MKSKAIVFRKADKPSLETIEIPEPGMDEVVIRTEFSGVSIGTEKSIFSGKRINNGSFPLVGGYMLSGIVERTGGELDNIKTGDRVICHGARLDCGINSVWGAHSQFVTANKDTVIKVEDGIKMEEAAMFVLPSVGLNAFKLAGVECTDAVIVQGQGLIGQFYAQFCKDKGAEVLTIEPNSLRAELSGKYVTESVFNPDAPEISQWIDIMINSGKRLVVTEATGNKNLIGNAVNYLCPNSIFVFLGWYPDKIEVDYKSFHANQAKAIFPMGSGNKETWREVLSCIGSGKVKIKSNITDILDYSEACKGYERIISRDNSIMGMVFDWRNS